MFGLRSGKPDDAAHPGERLDRLARRKPVEPVQGSDASTDRDGRLAAATTSLGEAVAPKLRDMLKAGAPAGEITRQAGALAQLHFRSHGVPLAPLELRSHVAELVRRILPATPVSVPAPDAAAEPVLLSSPPVLPPLPASRPLEAARAETADKSASRLSRSKVEQARRAIQPLVMNRIDLAAAVSLPRAELVRQLEDLVAELLAEHRLQLNRPEQQDLVYQLVNDMMGLGPLEPLLEDETVTDIMINGPKQIYIERFGKLELTSVSFEDNTHLLNICNRIVSRIGRRVDESSPICDARLVDGSRVNIIIPPLAIDGAS